MKAHIYFYVIGIVALGIVGVSVAWRSSRPLGNAESVTTPAMNQLTETTADIIPMAVLENTPSLDVASTSPIKALSTTSPMSSDAPSAPKKVDLVLLKPSPVEEVPSKPTTTEQPTLPYIPGTISRDILTISGYWFLENTTTTSARWPKVPEPTDRAINPRAIVGLLCHGQKEDDQWSGTGNIINPQGYILTNHHMAEKAKYCEVAVPKQTAVPIHAEIADFGRNPPLNVSGWRPYKAVNFFIPSHSTSAMSGLEAESLDFAIMKIDSVNDGCETWDACQPLPTSFPYNPVSNFHMPTSTAGQAFPNVLDNINFYVPLMPYEVLMYGYPAIGGATGLGSFEMRSNLGYAIAYLPGDKKYDGYPIVMLTRMLYTNYGGASGSGLFYRGHIIGLNYAGFLDLAVVNFVIPMPFISTVLKDNAMDWVLSTE